ncbi:flagellar protein FlaG [Aestuariirhabdus sp. LZHN29]|uniref:flagellar protein FlaG n=1 Tax=Aestuariirhabdus sp. LZHN29 TaxID=3417462 RepID=UPI003CEFAE5A
MNIDNTLSVTRIATEARSESAAKQASVTEPSVQAAQAAESMQKIQARKTDEAQAEQQAQESSRVQVDEAVSNLNDFVQNIRRDLSFKVDEEAGQVVVQVTDYQTGKMIRQIPSEEALELAERLSEARSLLFEAKA